MINAVRPMTTARPASAPKAAAPAQAAEKPVAVAKKPVVAPVQAQEWTLGRVAKAAGAGVAGFVGGTGATVVADLFFHFGNNGGTAWPGGIYLTVAGLVAAGAIALYAKHSAK